MIQEYLIAKDIEFDIESLTVPETVKIVIRNIEDSNYQLVECQMHGENEQTACILSRLNDSILEEYSLTILQNGCSSYFNKTLFPVINEFEHKLRELLYLASSLGDNKDEIKDLEDKDFGKIFELLFIDRTFVNNTKEIVNDKNGPGIFTQKEILDKVKRLSEKVLWDDLIGQGNVTTLRDNFHEIRCYRNDVMHAHNMTEKQFKEARKLFKTTNRELDEAITFIKKPMREMADKGIVTSDFNGVMSAALKSMKKQNDFSSIANAFHGINNFDNLGISNSLRTILQNQPQFNLASSYMSSSAMQAATESLKRSVASIQMNLEPTKAALSSLSKTLEKQHIKIPNELFELQDHLKDMEENISSEGNTDK